MAALLVAWMAAATAPAESTELPRFPASRARAACPPSKVRFASPLLCSYAPSMLYGVVDFTDDVWFSISFCIKQVMTTALLLDMPLPCSSNSSRCAVHSSSSSLIMAAAEVPVGMEALLPTATTTWAAARGAQGATAARWTTTSREEEEEEEEEEEGAMAATGARLLSRPARSADREPLRAAWTEATSRIKQRGFLFFKHPIFQGAFSLIPRGIRTGSIKF
jgi:hypothetical protein